MVAATSFVLALTAAVVAVISCRALKSQEFPARPETELFGNRPLIVEFTCPAIYGRYPHPLSCEYFFECRFSYPILMHCNRGYLYDESREQCREKRKVNCRRGDHKDNKDKIPEKKEEIKNFKCPYSWGTFAHPNDCSKYFLCLYNVPKLLQCHGSELFHDKARKCLHRNKVDCGNRPDRDGTKTSWEPLRSTAKTVITTPAIPMTTKVHKKFVCPFMTGRFADPEDCSQYYECHSFQAALRKCPRSTLFDDSQGKCREEWLVNCRKTSWKPLTPTTKTVITTTVIPPTMEDHKKFICPFEFGRFADPEDCSQYYDCHFFEAFLQECPRSTLFDDSQGKCREERLVDCGDVSGTKSSWKPLTPTTKIVIPTTAIPTTAEDHKKFICPKTSFPFGRFADPEDCSQYYDCHFFEPFLRKCPKSTLFDVNQGECRAESLVDCGDGFGTKASWKPLTPTTKTVITTTAIPTTTEEYKKFFCPFPSGRYADPEDCSQYFECHSSRASLRQCPRSTLYDERREECREARLVRCGNRPGGIGGDLEDGKETVYCPYTWGSFAHPTDCSKYIICIYNFPTVFTCRKNELFHAYIRRCLPKNKVSCDNRINPDDLFPPGKSTSVAIFPTTTKKITITTASITPEPTTTTTLKPTTTTTAHTTITTTAPTTATTPEPTTTTTPEPTTTTTSEPTITTTSEPTTTTTPEPTTTTTPEPTTTSSPEPTTTTTSPKPTTTSTAEPITTTTPAPTTTTTPEPTTTTTPEPTTTTTPEPITTPTPEQTTTSSPEPTTTTTSEPTATIPTKSTTITQFPVTKPNTPPPTDCNEDDLDCIIDDTGDVKGWFDCPERYGHFPHGSSKQLFIHCDNFRPFVKKCADQTEFSPEYLVCTWVDKTKGV